MREIVQAKLAQYEEQSSQLVTEYHIQIFTSCKLSQCTFSNLLFKILKSVTNDEMKTSARLNHFHWLPFWQNLIFSSSTSKRNSKN